MRKRPGGRHIVVLCLSSNQVATVTIICPRVMVVARSRCQRRSRPRPHPQSHQRSLGHARLGVPPIRTHGKQNVIGALANAVAANDAKNFGLARAGVMRVPSLGKPSVLGLSAMVAPEGAQTRRVSKGRKGSLCHLLPLRTCFPTSYRPKERCGEALPIGSSRWHPTTIRWSSKMNLMFPCTFIVHSSTVETIN